MGASIPKSLLYNVTHHWKETYRSTWSKIKQSVFQCSKAFCKSVFTQKELKEADGGGGGFQYYIVFIIIIRVWLWNVLFRSERRLC